MRAKELARLKTDRNLLACALEDAGGTVDRDAVCCPFHNDNNPSGSIHPGNGDGAYLYTCQAECGWHNGNNSGDVLAVVQRSKRVGFRKAYAILMVLEAGPVIQRVAAGMGSKPTQVSPYQDGDGCVRFITVRFEDRDGNKTYRPFHRGPAGWQTGDPPPPLPLYGLPDLDQAGAVYVVEGEKCVEAAREIGLTATTSAHGAKSAKKTDWSPLAGRDVVILPDNNDAGRKYAEDVVRIATALSPPARIKIVGLPGVSNGGDIVDYLEAQESKEPDKLRAGIEALAESAPVLASSCTPKGEATSEKQGFVLRPLADLLNDPPEDIPWIVDGLLPAGGFSIFVAKPKVGKSTTARPLAFSIARGEPFLGLACQQGSVIYLALEDKGSEVTEHFRAMGATDSDKNILVHVGPAPPEPKIAIKSLLEVIEEHRPALVIIDTLLRFIRLRDANDYPTVIAALEPLLQAARSTGCHIMALHHAVKAEGRADGDNILGSTVFFATADTVLSMERKKSGERTLKSVQRYGEDLPTTVLIMDPETRRISSEAGAMIEHIADQEREAEVLKALANGPVSESGIRKVVGGDNNKIAETLKAMVDAERVLKASNQGKGGGYRYSLPAAPLGNSEKPEADNGSDVKADLGRDTGEAA